MASLPVRSAQREARYRQAVNAAKGCGVAVLVLVATLIPSTGLCADAKDRATFCYNDWPPMTQTVSGRAEGISIAMIREAGRRIGVATEFREFPWKRCLLLVEKGEIDAVIDAAKRKEFIHGQASFSGYSDTIWIRRTDDPRNLSDLKGASFGLVEGFSYDDKTTGAIEALDATVAFAVDDPTNIRKLAFGRVDAIIADLASTLHFAQTNKLEIQPILPPVYVEPLYVSFNKDRAPLMARFDAAFRRLLDEGFADTVYARYLGMTFSELDTHE